MENWKVVLTKSNTTCCLEELIDVLIFWVFISHHKIKYRLWFPAWGDYLSMIPVLFAFSFLAFSLSWCIVIVSWFLGVSSFCAASLLHTDRELFTPRGVSSSDYLKNRLFHPSLSKKLEDRKTFRTIKFLRLLPSRQRKVLLECVL